MPIALLAALTAFLLTYFILPSVIKVAFSRQLYDEPKLRSSHFQPTPSIGGVAIFASFLIAILFWLPNELLAELKYILVATVIIFLTGLKDDLMPMSAVTKLVAQLVVATLIVYFADIRLVSLHGMFSWMAEMPFQLSIVLSILTVLIVVNAFNLIDGINGLSASMGILVMAVLGTWFIGVGYDAYGILAFTVVGALLGFLPYNLFPPTRIFMGDTGALVVGLLVATLTLNFIELNDALPPESAWRVDAVPVVAMTIIAIPLFDTLRVFFTRIIRGVSPFQPDRRHIHHLLIDFGFPHATATGILVACQAALIGLVYPLQGNLEKHLLLLLLLSIVMAATYVLYKATKRKKAALNELLEADEERAIPAPSSPVFEKEGSLN